MGLAFTLTLAFLLLTVFFGLGFYLDLDLGFDLDLDVGLDLDVDPDLDLYLRP